MWRCVAAQFTIRGLYPTSASLWLARGGGQTTCRVGQNRRNVKSASLSLSQPARLSPFSGRLGRDRQIIATAARPYRCRGHAKRRL